jgi:hypothetical protein
MGDPSIRRALRPDTVQLDQMQPEMTVSVMGIGAHLVLLWTPAEARAAFEALRRVLEDEDGGR